MKFKPRFRDDNVKFKAKFATTDSVVNELVVTENGEYPAPNGVDGFNPVKVNVPLPDGFIKPEGTINITQDGEWDVRNFEKANVNASGAVGEQLVALIEGTLTSITSRDVTKIREYAFFCSTIKSANFPNVTSVEKSGFSDCRTMSNINMPNVEYLGEKALLNCYELTTVNFPKLSSVAYNGNTFNGCKALTEVICPNLSMIQPGMFGNCTALKSISFPLAIEVRSNGFSYNKALETVDLPNVTRLHDGAFGSCSALKDVTLPLCVTIGGSFETCKNLESIDLPKCTTVGAKAFYNCYSLKTIILRSEKGVATLGNSYSLYNCYHFHGTVNATYNPNGLKDGFIYVPRKFVESYKVATNWSALASQFRAIEDYPEICG